VQRAVCDERVSEGSEGRAKAVLVKLADALLTEVGDEEDDDENGNGSSSLLRSLRGQRRAVLRVAMATQ